MDKLNIAAQDTKLSQKIKVAYLKNNQWKVADRLLISSPKYRWYSRLSDYNIRSEKDVQRVIAAVVKKYKVAPEDIKVIKPVNVEYDVYSEQDIQDIAKQRAQAKARKTIHALRNKINKERAKLRQMKGQLRAAKK